MNTALNHPTRCVLKPGLNAAGGVLSSDGGEGILPHRTGRQRGKEPFAQPTRGPIASPATTQWASDSD
jgi:hypothetical protein